MAPEPVPVDTRTAVPAADGVDAGPSAAWRTRSPGALGAAEGASLALLVAAARLPGEPRWAAARKGDPAAAVAVAIRHVRVYGADSATSDIVMGNLLLLAERGDAGARPVMAFALRALARRRAGDRRLLRLAALWGRAGTRPPRRRR